MRRYIGQAIVIAILLSAATFTEALLMGQGREGGKEDRAVRRLGPRTIVHRCSSVKSGNISSIAAARQKDLSARSTYRIQTSNSNSMVSRRRAIRQGARNTPTRACG